MTHFEAIDTNGNAYCWTALLAIDRGLCRHLLIMALIILLREIDFLIECKKSKFARHVNGILNDCFECV